MKGTGLAVNGGMAAEKNLVEPKRLSSTAVDIGGAGEIVMPVETDAEQHRTQSTLERQNIDDEVSAAQIRALYEHMPLVLAVNVVNSALVALVLASYLNQTRWWIFFGLVVSLTGLRAVGWRWYRHHRTRVVTKTAWMIFATVGSGLSGLLWGAASILFLSDDIVERTFMAFVVGGMCAGALVSLSYYLPAFIAYVFSSALPLAATFFLDGKMVYTAMGGMAVVFVAAVTFAAHHFNRAFIGGVRLNLDIGQRTKELIKRTEELTAANSRLEAEISQRKRAEGQLHQAQKMDALGQLTGGIAHDFNNLLTAVIGSVELAQKRARGDPEMSRLLEGALNAAERGATAIQQLLAFARRQPLQPKPVDVPAAIDYVEKILKQTISPDISLLIRVEPGLRPAWVDPNQLELAVLNLALNARDAMPSGGKLQITCKNWRTDADSAPPELATGDYVVVTVSDTGTGMSETTLARAFEPFFTTKAAGRGSGLGLSMVQGFAGQSGGTVQIVSSLGEGANVTLWLPCAKGSTIESIAPEPGRSALGPSQARILVCDDDGDVRAFVSTFLRSNGSTVWEANNPAVALQILEQERPIDLLLVDYVMPEMTGLAVIYRAQTYQPGLRALLMTGYADALPAEGISEIPILPKPFRVAELNRKIAEILDGLSSGDSRVDESAC